MYGNKVFIRGIIRSVNVGYNVRNHKAVKMTVDSVNEDRSLTTITVYLITDEDYKKNTNKNVEIEAHIETHLGLRIVVDKCELVEE